MTLSKSHVRRAALLATTCALALALAACAGSKTIDVGDDSSTSPTGSPTPVSFASAVVPVFTAKGCAGTGCHSGATPSGALNLSGSASAVFTALSNGGASQTGSVKEVDRATPANSLILKKPLATDTATTHAGGKQFPTVTDASYKTILTWIQQGGLNN